MRRQEWEAALRWLEQAAQDEPLEKEVREVHLIIQTIPWKTELRLLRSRLTDSGDGHFSIKWMAFEQPDRHGAFIHCSLSTSDKQWPISNVAISLGRLYSQSS